MVELSNASPNPEAVVVKLSNASIAVSAMLRAEGEHVNLTNRAASILRNLDLLDKSE